MASTSYQGTTSTAQNVPALVTQAIYWASSDVTGSTSTIGAGRKWMYSSTMTGPEVASTLYFAGEGGKIGFKRGDILQVFTGSTGLWYYSVLSVTSSGVAVFSSGISLV